jgi:hypothetical protein
MSEPSNQARVETLRRTRAWLLRKTAVGAGVRAESRDGRTVYVVPSETKMGALHYAFVDEGAAWVCTCEDFDARKEPCKHVCLVWDLHFPELAPPPPTEASLRLLRRERGAKGWYEGARRYEHVPYVYRDGPAESTRRDHAIVECDDRSTELLIDLRAVLNERYPVEAFAHRPTLPAGDKVLVSVLRSLHRKSMRRIVPLLKKLVEAGSLVFAPVKTSQVTYNCDSELTRYLATAFAVVASPYTLMEQDVVIDSSGFSTFFVSCWRDSDYGEDDIRPGTRWFKVHIAIGRVSKAILAVVVTEHIGPGTGDDANLRPLVADLVRRGFDLRYVIADNIYLTAENFAFVKDAGARLVGPLKKRNYAQGKPRPAVQELHAFKLAHAELYDELCRDRQPIEGVFSVEKRYDNRVAAIGSAEERKAAASGNGPTLFVSRQNEFWSRVIRHNVVRTVTEEHLRNRRIAYSKGSLFSHVRETVEIDGAS